MDLYIYTDGAARGNPGKSASGFRIYDSKHNLLTKSSFYNGERTNNAAEYIAVIAALKDAREKFGVGNDLELFSDSKLVISQLNGSFKIKSRDLMGLYDEASALLALFKSYKLNNVPRENEYIVLVDKELNVTLDRLG
ncbi:MAG: ribonuclease HI family protein [Candidatus Marsarchaeota archaeon]|jgi:ribonuclease HI|nr:ribonuclease HI family protein [Candidatus Marsarchaeota archaeon]